MNYPTPFLSDGEEVSFNSFQSFKVMLSPYRYKGDSVIVERDGSTTAIWGPDGSGLPESSRTCYFPC